MRILFIGTGEIGVPALRWLIENSKHRVIGVITQPDRPAGRAQMMRPSPVKVLATEHRIAVLQPEKIRDPDVIRHIRSLAPEVILVVAYGQILPRAILDAAPVACLNLHASLLPRHRGAAPVHAAIEAGDTETGITVMYMSEGLDSGDILLSRNTPIYPRDTTESLQERLAQLAPRVLEDSLDLLENGGATRTPQPEPGATYAGKLTREHARIDWSAPADVIDRKVRAMNPWPVAYTFLPGDQRLKMKIYATEPLSEASEAGPGQIIEADKHGISVGTGRGVIRLTEVQLEGKKRMSAQQFLLGHPLEKGMRLE
jgi:methionyl-tRNA formyltransferase